MMDNTYMWLEIESKDEFNNNYDDEELIDCSLNSEEMTKV